MPLTPPQLIDSARAIQQLQCSPPTGAGCCRLLDACSMALQPRTQEALLQLLLSAAQDEWREVAGPARTWLASHAAAASASEPDTAAGQAGSAFAAALEHLLLQLLEGLPAALRRGDLPGRQHAQQLTSAIQASAVLGRQRCIGSWDCGHCWCPRASFLACWAAINSAHACCLAALPAGVPAWLVCC